MNYLKIKEQFSRQSTEFLSSCVTKFKDAIGLAISSKDSKGEKLARKQLNAVKEILEERLPS